MPNNKNNDIISGWRQGETKTDATENIFKGMYF